MRKGGLVFNLMWLGWVTVSDAEGPLGQPGPGPRLLPDKLAGKVGPHFDSPALGLPAKPKQAETLPGMDFWGFDWSNISPD